MDSADQPRVDGVQLEQAEATSSRTVTGRDPAEAITEWLGVPQTPEISHGRAAVGPRWGRTYRPALVRHGAWRSVVSGAGGEGEAVAEVQKHRAEVERVQGLLQVLRGERDDLLKDKESLQLEVPSPRSTSRSHPSRSEPSFFPVTSIVKCATERLYSLVFFTLSSPANRLVHPLTPACR